MTGNPARGIRFSPTVVLILVVLALAAGALISRNFDGPAPGTLRLGVLAAESPRRIERSAGPLASWLGQSINRAGEVVAPGTAGLVELAGRCDVMLVPESEVHHLDRDRLLAWVRPLGVAKVREDYMVVHSGRSEGPCMGAVATQGLIGALEETRCDSVVVAGSPFAERELLRALVSGGYGAVLVRASVIEDARLAGWLSHPDTIVAASIDSQPWMALVASPGFDSDLRRRVQEGALNLDKFRLDPSRTHAASVFNALAELGIGGFAAPEPFATLRP
jgi:hypothetical protein